MHPAKTACIFSTSQLVFLLTNVFRDTTACNCSSLIWPAGSAPAALASLLFDPPEPQLIGKTWCIATFLPFRAPVSSFFSDFLPSFLDLSDSFHLCFPTVHIVGSFTSKFPSTKGNQKYTNSGQTKTIPENKNIHSFLAE